VFFFATELAKHSRREVAATATTAMALLLDATSKPTVAATTVATGVVASVASATTLGGHVHRWVVGAATPLHALLKASKLGE
jgi:hypothetical protein